jgi:hypothetical protein
MVADVTPEPATPITETEFADWMARLGFRITATEACEMLAAYQLLARMKARVRSDRDVSVEPAHRFVVR